MTITLDIGMKEENNRLFGVTVILLVEAQFVGDWHVSYSRFAKPASPLQQAQKFYCATFIAGVAREIAPTILGYSNPRPPPYSQE